jgi:hypothetical protein
LAPSPPWQTELALPARTPRDIFAVCDPVRALTPEEQPVLHEDLSVVQGGDRFGRIELRLRRAGPGRYLRELVTGHSGCGKSTELLRSPARCACRETAPRSTWCTSTPTRR